VLLGGILRVLDGLNVVGMRQVGLVGGFLNRSLDLMFSGFEVVLSGLFEIFGGLFVIFSCLLRHFVSPFQGISIFSESATTPDYQPPGRP
jgi:hypothetical protein